MKRKILILSFGILIFTCLFAMSVFATVNYEETATLADGTILPIYDENHSPLIWWVSGEENGKNVYSSVPNNRKEANAKNDTYVTYTNSNTNQLKDITIHIYDEASGTYIPYTDKDLKLVVVNLRGLTGFVYLNQGFTFKNIQYIYFHEELLDCCKFFAGSTDLRLVDLTVCTKMTGGFGGVRNFYQCSNLHTIRFAPDVSYSLKCSQNNNWRFSGTAVVSFVFPENITDLGIDNFKDNSKLESIYILGNNTSLGQRNFLNCPKLTNIYILGDNPEITATEFAENFYSCVDGNNVLDFSNTGKYFFFATDNAEYLEQMRSAIEASAVISYSSYKANPQNYTEGRYIISGTNVCDVYYGAHKIDEETSNSCAGICSVCGSVVMAENPVHNYVITIEYTSYLENGRKIHTCQNSNCVHNETPYVINTLPLFTCQGYSAPENGDGGISIKYTVNSAAIEEYTKATGIELSYGLFATTKQAIGNADIFDGEGNTINGAIALDITKADFAFLSLKMVGFDTEESKKVDFAIGAYVVTTENGLKKYSYLQQGTPVDGEKYAYIKYNDFVSTNS